MSSNGTTSDDDGDDWVFYAYNPSKVWCIVVSALFGVLFLLHAAVTTRKRMWRTLWPFNLGVAAECIGYAFRRISAEHVKGRSQGLKWFLAQNLSIILAPAFMAASMYMLFGRLIQYVNVEHSPIRPSRVTFIFVTFDVISFAVQGAGGSLYASDDSSIYNLAKGILVAGFLIQIISFGVFVTCAITYHRRCDKAQQLETKEYRWRNLLWTFYIVSFMILLRSVFRTIEFAQGNSVTSKLQSTESIYYCLETLPIILATITFLIGHPSRWIPSNLNERVQQQPMTTEIKNEQDQHVTQV